MSRRIIMGRSGSVNYGLRVSKAGYDALAAGLDGLLFDSDLIAAKAFAGNTFLTNVNNNLGRSSPQAPAVTTAPHGLSGTFIAAAIARPGALYTGADADRWSGWGSGITGTMVAAVYLDPTKSFATPHYYRQNFSTGALAEGGWTFSWDGTNFYVHNYCSHTLFVRWKAMRVG